MAPAMQFKVHPAEEKNSGLEDDEEVERARAVAAALGASLNVRLEKWHERTERHKQETVEGWILRQQGLITMLFTFLVFSPAWALFFNRVEGWAAWDSYVYVFTVITTIGYGNMYPSGPTGMYATILMGLTGIPLTCYALAWVGTASLRASHVILSNCRRRLGYAGKPTKMQEIYFSVFLFSAHFAHCVAVFCAMEAWTVTISCYYTFVTLSTVGLGDEIALYYKPQSRTWWRVLRAGAAEPYTDPDFRWEAGARPIRSATLEKIHWYHLWYLLAVFCGLAFVSQLFTLIVHWIHNLDDSFDREFSHIAGHMRLMGRRGRKAMACRHRDRSRDEQRAAKLLTKQRELLATQQQQGPGLGCELLELVRIRRQLLAAAFVAGGEDWYHVLKSIDADGDGKITRAEFGTWVRSVLPAGQAGEHHVNTMFDLADHDQSGDLGVEDLAWLLDSAQDHHDAPRDSTVPATNS
jgi:hypothetical protein